MTEGNPPVSTRRGDDGTTLLGAGRLPKNDVRIALLGDVDERMLPLDWRVPRLMTGRLMNCCSNFSDSCTALWAT